MEGRKEACERERKETSSAKENKRAGENEKAGKRERGREAWERGL
jgi:hypothetical protein